MSAMLSEIKAMPEMALNFLENSPEYTLPKSVPYLGMGSSYFAPLAFKYMGIDLYPELASEFYNYRYAGTKIPEGVLLSQSGRSTELLWCAELFTQYTAISNYMDSPLCTRSAATKIIPLLAGEEHYSSSKTYLNTLLALFKGFGMDMRKAIQLLSAQMEAYQEQGMALAEEVFKLLQDSELHGLYITGSGPNIATAMQAALILSESTKLNFNGLPMAQYDHGPKETAKGSMVIQVLAAGKSYQRSKNLAEKILASGARVVTVEQPAASENESVLHNIIPFNFMAYHLSKKLNIGETFTVGGKITEVNQRNG